MDWKLIYSWRTLDNESGKHYCYFLTQQSAIENLAKWNVAGEYGKHKYIYGLLSLEKCRMNEKEEYYPKVYNMEVFDVV